MPNCTLNPDSILVVAAHPDDEVLGCGGTIARLAAEGHAVHVLIVAEGATSRTASRDRDRHADPLKELARCAELASRILSSTSLEMRALPDNRLDSVDLLDVVKLVEEAVRKHQPRLVLTHHSGDVNVDHRILHDAVVAACRPQPGCTVKELLFFEVPSSTEWRPPASAAPFCPDCFIDISEHLGRKLEALRAYHPEMRPYPHPRSIEAAEYLARWRGCGVGVDAAEAFVTGRRIL